VEWGKLMRTIDEVLSEEIAKKEALVGAKPAGIRMSPRTWRVLFREIGGVVVSSTPNKCAVKGCKKKRTGQRMTCPEHTEKKMADLPPAGMVPTYRGCPVIIDSGFPEGRVCLVYARGGHDLFIEVPYQITGSAVGLQRQAINRIRELYESDIFSRQVASAPLISSAWPQDAWVGSPVQVPFTTLHSPAEVTYRGDAVSYTLWEDESFESASRNSVQDPGTNGASQASQLVVGENSTGSTSRNP
jgi:hypothetical protein